ncbi:MAG: acylneuraminate cytidylyltransferase family protein [Alphaproteobacteria bacterium]|nr:acylneuraminate cytidylyltransferase family protein [Alphaproteobacteria bacterium]
MVENSSSHSIAIIPARGGSKRIPKKNIRDFKGKPMIAWTIGAALESGLFQHVLVSTDDPEIAEIVVEHGAECPFLREEHHDDHSPVSEATLKALFQAQEHYNETYDIVAQLMPNCPLRSAVTIKNMFEKFTAEQVDFMLSHTRYGWLNPWWACEMDKSGEVKPLFEQKLKERSQDLPELCCPTGAVWMARCKDFIEHKTFHAPGKKAFIMDWQEAVDIDDMDDWAMAELLFDKLNSNRD